MITTQRTFSADENPAEFTVSLATKNWLHAAEWRSGERSVSEDGSTMTVTCHYVLRGCPATYDNLVAMLAACRYTTSEEVALMRKPDDDHDKVEHEAYIAAAKAFAEAFFASRENAD